MYKCQDLDRNVIEVWYQIDFTELDVHSFIQLFPPGEGHRNSAKRSRLMEKRRERERMVLSHLLIVIEIIINSLRSGTRSSSRK